MLITRPELVGDFGMVASTHWLASSTGMSVLERGGNAADAAAAAGFVLQVVEPHLNGPGGEVPILLWDNGVSVICGQGVAPMAATPAAFADLGLDLVPGTGQLPAVVPGAFGAWTRLVEQWGTWRLRDVLAPALALAHSGHPLLLAVSQSIESVADMFREHWPSSAATWLRSGGAPAAGDRFRNRVLASTYERLIAEAESRTSDRDGQFAAARDVWYRGFVAEAIGTFCANEEVMDTSGRPHRGLLTADDMAAWEPTVEEPQTFDYGEYTVCKTGPWGQGPVFLQQLALLAHTDLAAAEHLSADWVHTIVEATKLAFADREAWYGDPNFVDVPMAELLDPAYNAQRAKLINGQVSLEYRPGSPGDRQPMLPTRWSTPDGRRPAAGVGEPTVTSDGHVRGDTCHLDVVDSNGMMITATPSGGWLQSSPVIPDLGFCVTTRGQMFWLEEGLPDTIRPGMRPRTTLSPSMALREGEPYLAFGTPGGDMQDQWTLHFFLNVVHGKQNLQEALDSADWHSLHPVSSFYPREADPARLLAEDRLGPDVLAELARRGHEITVTPPWSLGRTSAVARDGEWLKAAANARGGQGYAVGR